MTAETANRHAAARKVARGTVVNVGLIDMRKDLHERRGLGF
jgi:hypothetical protein